jgi:hypothetical protein
LTLRNTYVLNLRGLILDFQGTVSSLRSICIYDRPSCLYTLVLMNAECHPSQFQRWTNFGARVPYLKNLSILKPDGAPQWAQSSTGEVFALRTTPDIHSAEAPLLRKPVLHSDHIEMIKVPLQCKHNRNYLYIAYTFSIFSFFYQNT